MCFLLVAAFGIDISEESTIDPETGEGNNEEKKNVLKEIEGEYDSINKKLKERPGTRVSTVINKDPSLKYIKQQSYYKLVSSYMNAKEAEDATEDYVKEQVHNHYLWDMFFKDMVGCGEFLAGMLIAYLDVHKARHVSCFWSYAGLGCRFSEKTGKYEAQSKHNLTTRKYIDKNDGKEKECPSLGYNPVLHMWLLGRLPSNMFRAASRSNKHCELIDATEDYVKEQVHNHYLWDMFFKDMVGCGEFLAGMLIAYLDVHKARHVSCFWSYAGLGCRFSEKTGKYEAQSKHNLTTRKYIDKNDGKEKECPSLGYNPVLHMWLLGRLPSNMFRAASRSNKHCELIECYRDYYNRYENRADNQEKPSKARCMRRASRAMAKYLLRELWCVWREAEGYTLSVPYEVEYLGRAPHRYNEAHARMAARD